MTDILELAAKVEALPKGARRAYDAMTTDWQQPSATTFNWAGAWQAHNRLPEFIECAAVKLGKQRHARTAYRLRAKEAEEIQ